MEGIANPERISYLIEDIKLVGFISVGMFAFIMLLLGYIWHSRTDKVDSAIKELVTSNSNLKEVVLLMKAEQKAQRKEIDTQWAHIDKLRT